MNIVKIYYALLMLFLWLKFMNWTQAFFKMSAGVIWNPHQHIYLHQSALRISVFLCWNRQMVCYEDKVMFVFVFNLPLVNIYWNRISLPRLIRVNPIILFSVWLENVLVDYSISCARKLSENSLMFACLL